MDTFRQKLDGVSGIVVAAPNRLRKCGRSGNALTLDALTINQTLQVEGVRQADGSILANKISIEDDDENEEPVPC